MGKFLTFSKGCHAYYAIKGKKKQKTHAMMIMVNTKEEQVINIVSQESIVNVFLDG